MQTKPRRGYWYMFYVDYCVVCADTEITRVRVYDRPKPKEYSERYDYFEYACPGHFM